MHEMGAPSEGVFPHVPFQKGDVQKKGARLCLWGECSNRNPRAVRHAPLGHGSNVVLDRHFTSGRSSDAPRVPVSNSKTVLFPRLSHQGPPPERFEESRCLHLGGFDAKPEEGLGTVSAWT